MLGVVGGASPPRVVDDGIVVPQLQGPLSGVGLDELKLEAAKATPAGKKSSLRLACKTLASKSFWHRPDDLGTQALGLEVTRARPTAPLGGTDGAATRGRWKQNGFASRARGGRGGLPRVAQVPRVHLRADQVRLGRRDACPLLPVPRLVRGVPFHASVVVFELHPSSRMDTRAIVVFARASSSDTWPRRARRRRVAAAGLLVLVRADALRG